MSYKKQKLYFRTMFLSASFIILVGSQLGDPLIALIGILLFLHLYNVAYKAWRIVHLKKINNDLPNEVQDALREDRDINPNNMIEPSPGNQKQIDTSITG
jgi:hypothetical protein